MANQDPPLYYFQPNSAIRDHLPFQSRFGPWFYKADEYGADDYQFWGVTGFFITVAIAAILLNFSQISELYTRRGYRWKYITRALLQQLALIGFVFLGWTIVGSTFSYKWSEAEIVDTFRYRAGSNEHVHARLGLHMGLTGFNVTLVGLPEQQHNQLIYWNERYSWQDAQGETRGWNHGRFGFGAYSNLMSQQFRAGQYRGTPIPILEVLEWFALDGEDLRWNRWYLNGSYYCYVFLWCAFPFYLITAITFSLRPATGALWLSLTGLTMWFAATLYSGLIQKAPPLSIPFGEHHLAPKTSTTYFLVLSVGIITNVIGAVLAYAFHTRTSKIEKFVKYIQSPSEIRARQSVLQTVQATSQSNEGSRQASVRQTSLRSKFGGWHSSSTRGSSVRRGGGSGTTGRRSSTDLASLMLEDCGPITVATTSHTGIPKKQASRAKQLRTRQSRRNRTKFGQKVSVETFQHMQAILESDGEEYEPASPNPLSGAASYNDLNDLNDRMGAVETASRKEDQNQLRPPSSSSRVIDFDTHVPHENGGHAEEYSMSTWNQSGGTDINPSDPHPITEL